MKHFNQLTPKENEALALLMEECAEVIQIIGKIQRHGLESCHPENLSITNRDLLEREIGHVLCAEEILRKCDVTRERDVQDSYVRKCESVGKYLHHINTKAL